jgi:Ca-activated chloride channel family protein
MQDIEFAHPDFFWLMLLLPLLAGWYLWRQRSLSPTLRFPTVGYFQVPSFGIYDVLRHVVFALRLVALGLMITALARPQSSSSWQDISTEGIDIVISLDISGSMLAEDLKPNRLEAAKAVAMKFVEKRHSDRIGLVVYSGESFTQCPLTTDHSVLKNLFSQIKNGMIEDGTAIGLGLATAVNRLKESEAKSKVVILLTDGVNNRGAIPPLTAAEIAKAFSIRVYTIGVGTNGQAPYPVQTPFGKQYQYEEVKIDEDMMKEIARLTGGRYFRATDNKKLEEIYAEIDALEKSKIDVTEYRKRSEEYLPWLMMSAALLAAEFLLRKTILKSAF